jgi:endonuclease-3
MEMRRENPAAVDTMGAHTVSDKKATANEQAFHTLVGLMLSSQTKDEVTSATMKHLV